MSNGWCRFVLMASVSVALTASLTASNANSTITLNDDEGRTVNLQMPARRIATLSPALTELVYAAGAGSTLVGVSAYSDYPTEALKLPIIADASGVSFESLLAARPDLVLVWKGGSKPNDVARLKDLGVEIFAIEVRGLADLPRTLGVIGTLVGQMDAANRAAERIRLKIRALKTANALKQPVRVFVEISQKPLLTVNREHFISGLLETCGGINAWADAPVLVSEPSREQLLGRPVDAIIFGQSRSKTHLDDAPVYVGMSAISQKQVYGVTADYLFRPGPRMFAAAEEICVVLDRARETMRGKDVSKR